MLVFRNGYIAYREQETSEFFDESGNPIIDEENETLVECYIDTTSENKKGRYDDGSFTQYQMSINVNMSDVPLGFNPKEVSVTHDRKGFLGTFIVQRVEYYDLTQTIVIWL